MPKKPTNRTLLERARHNRRNPTPAEEALWSELRCRQVCGMKFRRQHVMAPYIVDFACLALGLVVEVDGDSHDPDGDAVRTVALAQRHDVVEVLRFGNGEVLDHRQQVVKEIERWIAEQVRDE